MGGSADQVFDDFNTPISISWIGAKPLQNALIFSEMGTSTSDAVLSRFQSIAPVQRDTAALLGAPLTSAALSLLLQFKTSVLKHMVTCLRLLDAHDTVYLLCNCFTIPKLLYLFCTSPTWRANEDLMTFDTILKSALQEICNIQLDTFMWSQATLPTSQGGLGIRQAVVSLPF